MVARTRYKFVQSALEVRRLVIVSQKELHNGLLPLRTVESPISQSVGRFVSAGMGGQRGDGADERGEDGAERFHGNIPGEEKLNGARVQVSSS